MDRRTVQLNIGGQTFRVVSATSSEGDLLRLAARVDEKMTEIAPRGRSAPNALLLAALALAHDAEEERARREQLEKRTRDVLRRALVRIDHALDAGGPEPVPSAE